MFGLSSVAGTPGQTQAQTAQRTADSTTEVDRDETPRLIDSVQAAERVLRSAVEAIRSAESEARLKEEESSPKEQEQTAAEDRRAIERQMGSQLDVTA